MHSFNRQQLNTQEQIKYFCSVIRGFVRIDTHAKHSMYVCAVYKQHDIAL